MKVSDSVRNYGHSLEYRRVFENEGQSVVVCFARVHSNVPWGDPYIDLIGSKNHMLTADQLGFMARAMLLADSWLYAVAQQPDRLDPALDLAKIIPVEVINDCYT